MNPEILNRLRAFLKDDIRQQTDFRQTEQARGLPPPPLQTPCPPDARRIPLLIHRPSEEFFDAIKSLLRNPIRFV